MGILHLEVKRHRLERDFRLKVRVSKPRVSYRETLKKAIKIEGESVKQAGTTGLFAKVVGRVRADLGGAGGRSSSMRFRRRRSRPSSWRRRRTASVTPCNPASSAIR